MSRILSRISMFTGQISSHALHDVHAHSSSDVMRSNTESAVMVMPSVDADRRRHDRVAGGGHHLADLQHDLAGVERLAGRVRRAHRRAAPADRARVGVEQLLPGEVLDRRRAERLELGLHQVRHGLHRALGPVLVLQVHVHRRRDHVAELRGRQDHEERDERERSGCPTATGAACWSALADHESNSDESGYPTNDHFSKSGRPSQRDAQRLGEEAGDRDHEERDEDHRVLGLGLDADAVRALEVAAADRPHDADGEDDAGEVGGERVALVDAAVEELQVVGQLVVELEHDGRDEQPQEAEVDERVHQARRRDRAGASASTRRPGSRAMRRCRLRLVVRRSSGLPRS